MNLLTNDELRDIMRACVGNEPAAELEGDIFDRTFSDLAFDSLAVLEVAARLQETYRIPVPDEAVEKMKTPRDVVDYINQQLAAAA
ncbi:acyl carrier protein [Micromonospora sp. CPCC 205371]|nr:acyl carrier protein [Micromonospora sp. CPCC 205371]